MFSIESESESDYNIEMKYKIGDRVEIDRKKIHSKDINKELENISYIGIITEIDSGKKYCHIGNVTRWIHEEVIIGVVEPINDRFELLDIR